MYRMKRYLQEKKREKRTLPIGEGREGLLNSIFIRFVTKTF